MKKFIIFIAYSLIFTSFQSEAKELKIDLNKKSIDQLANDILTDKIFEEELDVNSDQISIISID